MTDLLDLKTRYQSSPQTLTDHELCELATKAPSRKLSIQNIFSSSEEAATIATGAGQLIRDRARGTAGTVPFKTPRPP